MCLAIPAKIITVERMHAWADTMGVMQKVNIQLLDTPVPGDYILVHAGFAIEKIEPEQFGLFSKTLLQMLEGYADEGT